MTLLQERVETVAEAIQEQTYLVIRRQVVIATLTADCAVCALTKRDAEYPGVLLGAMVLEAGRTRVLERAAQGGGRGARASNPGGGEMSEVLYYAGGRDQHVGAYVFRVRNEVPGDLADQADAEQGPGRRQAAAAGGGGVNG